MKKRYLFIFIFLMSFPAWSQTNIISSNPQAQVIMKGLYNPATYLPSQILNHPDSIASGINREVRTDSLKSYLLKLRTFHNRNTGSDTISQINGIGAARAWVHSKFQEFSNAAAGRLLPSYLQFDQSICAITRHKNIFAVLPGLDTTDKSIVIIEGHIDSRCEAVCDTACLAEGEEDNGSGTALVMELARVMSKYSFSRTIVFLVTIGEEQGLYGAEAFADYVQQQNIKVKAVLNNDVIGGIICGQTSSAPSCPGLNNIDSTHVRLFSLGNYNSFHKGLCRFIKLEYKEELLPVVNVPMTLLIMSPEDRTGRGGDHIPFRQHGYIAMRFTAANEHGDASNGTGYTDRQHSTRDILGVDTNNDQVIDSFFVNMNYLARNAVINGVSAGMAGIGPKTPDFILGSNGSNQLYIQITQQTQYDQYRIGVRVSSSNDWDSVYTLSGALVDTITVNPGSIYYVSVASVDTNGVESLFSREYFANLNATFVKKEQEIKDIQLLQNFPNPFDEATYINVLVNKNRKFNKAWISIRDLSGKEIQHLPLDLKEGNNEVLYSHGYNVSGTYTYSLVIDGEIYQTCKMQFIN